MLLLQLNRLDTCVVLVKFQPKSVADCLLTFFVQLVNELRVPSNFVIC